MEDTVPDLEDMSDFIERRRLKSHNPTTLASTKAANSSDIPRKGAPPLPIEALARTENVPSKGLCSHPLSTESSDSNNDGSTGDETSLVGREVCIYGLKSKPQYNGCKGVAEGLDGGRWVVLVGLNTKGGEKEGGGTRLRVKASNIALVDSSDDGPIIKPRSVDSFRFAEVQQAMEAVKRDTSWLNEALLNKLSQDPFLSKALQDPRVSEAMRELAQDPQAAMKKYSSEPQLAQLLKKFMGVMGAHLEELGVSSALPPSSLPSPSQPVPLQQERQVSEGQMQRWMADPKIRAALDDEKTQAMLAAIKADGAAYKTYRNTPQLRILVAAGILLVPPEFK